MFTLEFWPNQICARPVASPHNHYAALGTSLLTHYLGLFVDRLSSMTALLSSGGCFATRLWGLLFSSVQHCVHQSSSICRPSSSVLCAMWRQRPACICFNC